MTPLVFPPAYLQLVAILVLLIGFSAIFLVALEITARLINRTVQMWGMIDVFREVARQRRMRRAVIGAWKENQR